MPFSFSPNADHKINTTESNFVAPNILQRATIDDTDLVSSLLTNIFVFLVLVSIALFGYNFYLSNSITGKQAQISDYEKNLDIQDLDGVKSLSSRINVAKKIVDQFPFITTSFMVVSKSVENSIFYKSFNLSSDDKSNGYTLILSGVAPNYKSVIQQVDTFKSNTFSGNVSSVNVGLFHQIKLVMLIFH